MTTVLILRTRWLVWEEQQNSVVLVLDMICAWIKLMIMGMATEDATAIFTRTWGASAVQFTELALS
ncbi:hypothetical protein CPHO_12430 (plasmid) [Corynebacterium phocae]|uniref:Uncharacterized protein n=1 Tax=Corynebacterium phocae TaxID=161895 RepID=A0A1L7D6N5_9CORY|nr:hypothetical protein CPHO_12430 [Corynebacterium phocae]